MSLELIKAGLERRLGLLAPAIETAFENTAYGPKTNVPYQRVYHLINRPTAPYMTQEGCIERGIFQVSAFFPIDSGRGLAGVHAQAVRALFAQPLTLKEGGVEIDIYAPPHVGGGTPDGDRWHVPISIYWQAYISN